jgi:hypothetical protein
VRNVHSRTLPVPADSLAPLIDRLAGPSDPLWPAPAWPPVRFDRSLQVGAIGGHGPIRYSVAENEPGRLRCVFAAGLGAIGYHELRVESVGPRECRIVHEMVFRTRGSMRLYWPLAIRALHDALIEDLLDNAERASTGTVARPARWSPWVRLIRVAMSPMPRISPVPAEARLLNDAFGPRRAGELADAYEVALVPGVSPDPAAWRTAVFGGAPGWVRTALGVRNVLVGLIGVERADPSAFAPMATSADEVLVGVDANHLDFRASVLVRETAGRGTVTVSTRAMPHNRRGRLYLVPVRRLHPAVIRSMLRRGARMMATQAPSAAERTAQPAPS